MSVGLAHVGVAVGGERHEETPPIRPQDARDFRADLGGILRILKTLLKQDEIDAIVFKRNRMHVAVNESHMFEASARETLPTRLDHLFRVVDTDEASRDRRK